VGESIGGFGDKEAVAERVIICTNVCESRDSVGKIVKCPDMNTKRCWLLKDFDDSALPEKGLVELDHENLPPGLNRISMQKVSPGGVWGG